MVAGSNGIDTPNPVALTAPIVAVARNGLRAGERVMSDFKGRHFEGEIVLWAVRWYCRYGVSYRDLEQMIGERGVSIDHLTIYRWVQKRNTAAAKRFLGKALTGLKDKFPDDGSRPR